MSLSASGKSKGIIKILWTVFDIWRANSVTMNKQRIMHVTEAEVEFA